jgi:hypothetical protein
LLQRCVYRAGGPEKTPFVYCCIIAAFVYVAAGPCLLSRCLETAAVYFLISRPLLSNGFTRYSIKGSHNSMAMCKNILKLLKFSRYHPLDKILSLSALSLKEILETAIQIHSSTRVSSLK